MPDLLELTAYVGERDRDEHRLLADSLMDAYQRHGVRTGTLLRGIEGFGAKHRLQTERLLSLSEDLPIVALALDEPARIEALYEEVRGLLRAGMISLERTHRLERPEIPPGLATGPDAVKVTIQLGRGERTGSRPAFLAAVDCLRRAGLDGAGALLGLDGMAHGVRRRGRFIARNSQVPMSILSVGQPDSVQRALPELFAMLSDPTVTLKRVRVCRRDGVALAEPGALILDAAGLESMQKLTVYASEQTLYRGEALHAALIRHLRRDGAAGATALRGLWGYHGDHEPHGERFWSLRRHVPTVTVLIDTPENTLRWFEIVTEMTGESGLVTSETLERTTLGAGDPHGERSSDEGDMERSDAGRER